MRALQILGWILLAVFSILAIGLFLVGTFYRVPAQPTPLMRAAREGDVNSVRRLIAAGADVNERRGYSVRFGVFLVHGPSTATYGETALLVAIDRGDYEVVRALLDAGADPSVRDSSHRGMWDYATSHLGGAGSGIFFLLAGRFPVPPRYIEQALGDAGLIGDVQLLEFALRFRTSTAARTAALCGASARGDVVMMDRLLETFPAAPAQSLGCVLSGGGPRALRRPAMEYLLARGADPRAKSLAGLSAIELARSQGDEAEARFLEDWRTPGRSDLEPPNACPLICLKGESLQGCMGGCAVPASSAAPMYVDGASLDVGFWIRGTGPNGSLGKDGRFEIQVRRVIEQKPIECVFTIDARILGPRVQPCAESLGAIQVTVLPQ